MRSARSLSAAAALAMGAVLTLGAQPTGAVTPGYVALGDSYSSGLGAGNYGSSGMCRRSANAYPALWAGANSPASFAFMACAGARTDDVLSSQLGPLGPGTGLVSISVGGNDAGFGDVMTTCLLNPEQTCLNRIAEANRFVDEQLPGKLDRVYAAIRAKAPAAHVAVLGYPHLYRRGGTCAAGLSQGERSALNDASDHLNTVINKRAANAGFTFGDVRGTFTGHEICSADAWIHSVTWPIDESYHPTSAGQSYGYLPVFRSAA